MNLVVRVCQGGTWRAVVVRGCDGPMHAVESARRAGYLGELVKVETAPRGALLGDVIEACELQQGAA